MNWDQIKGDWHQLSRRLQEKWVQLTSEDLAAIAGRRGQLVVIPQGHNADEKERAEPELNQFIEGRTS